MIGAFQQIYSDTPPSSYISVWLLTKGFDYVAAANKQGRILNGLYGQAYGRQTRRTMRFQWVFMF